MLKCTLCLNIYLWNLTFPAENPDAQDPPSHLHPEEVHLWWDRFLCLEIVFTFEFPRQTHIGQTREVFPEEQHGFGANWTPWLHVTGQPRRSCTAIFFSAPRQLSPTGLLIGSYLRPPSQTERETQQNEAAKISQGHFRRDGLLLNWSLSHFLCKRRPRRPSGHFCLSQHLPFRLLFASPSDLSTRSGWICYSCI